MPATLLLVGLLTLPALFCGWQLDDWQQNQILQDRYEFASAESAWTEFFSFANGNPDANQQLTDRGILPWWTSGKLQLRFFRPLSVATHFADHVLWPRQPVLSHAHSVAWFLLCVYAAAGVYRRCGLSALGAGLAIVTFGIDDAHATTIAWIANRNHLIAGCLVLFAFQAHIAWQSLGRRRDGIASVLLFMAALLAGEIAVAFGGLVFAWAVTLHPGTMRQRLFSIIPGMCVGIIWLLMYQKMGFGGRFSGQYADPAGDPTAFLAALIERIPLFFAVCFGATSADAYTFAGNSTQQLIWLAAFAVFSAVLWVMFVVGRKNRELQFWLLATAITMLPICAGNPTDRVMMIVSFCGHGLIVRFLELVHPWLMKQTTPPDGEGQLKSASLANKIALLVAWFFLFVHVVLPLFLLPVRITAFGEYNRRITAAALSVADSTDMEGRTLILINAPDAFYPWHLPEIRRYHGLSAPGKIRMLGPAFVSLTVERKDDRVIVLRPDGPFLQSAMCDLYRDTSLPPNWERSLSDVHIRVTQTNPDGSPVAIRFEFAENLEQSDMAWVEWQDGKFVEFRPPAVGESAHIPARLDVTDMIPDLLRTAIGL